MELSMKVSGFAVLALNGWDGPRLSKLQILSCCGEYGDTPLAAVWICWLKIVLISAVILETDIPRRNHAVESAPQPALEKGSGVRNQQDQGKKIGEHSRYDQ